MPPRLTWAVMFCALPCVCICCMYCEPASLERIGLIVLFTFEVFFVRLSRLIRPAIGSFAMVGIEETAVAEAVEAPPKSPKSSSSLLAMTCCCDICGFPPLMTFGAAFPLGAKLPFIPCCCPMFILPKALLTAFKFEAAPICGTLACWTGLKVSNCC